VTRVLVLVKGLGRGGAERIVLDTVRSFDPDDVQAEVGFVLDRKDALVPELRQLGVAVHRLGRPNGVWPARLREVLQRGGHQVVHAHSPVVASAARILAPRRTRQVYTEHNVWERYRRPTRWANLTTFDRNDRVIAVSDGVARSIRYPVGLRSRRRPLVEVLVHGIDRERLVGSTSDGDPYAELGIPADARVLLSVANFKAAKRHRDLLLAFRAVAERCPEAYLVLAGTGPLESATREEAGSLGVADRVRFVGVRADVARLMGASHVFVLASSHEGLPVSLMEAMALGVPPVVTAVGGCPDVVEDGVSGRLVPPADPAELGRALVEVVRDEGERLRLARGARERAAVFDVSNAATRIAQIYREVTA